MTVQTFGRPTVWHPMQGEEKLTEGLQEKKNL